MQVYNGYNPGQNKFYCTILSNDENPGGGTVNVELVSGPSHGTLDPGSYFTYIPATQWIGTDKFTYRLWTMENGQPVYSNPATVTVTLTNTPPEPKNDLFMVKPGGSLTSRNVKVDNRNGPDTDPEHPQDQPLTFSLVSQPQQGTLSFSATGQFSYTAYATADGVDSFTYEVSDGQTTTTADVIIFIDDEAVAEADDRDGAFTDDNCDNGPAYSSEGNPHPILYFNIDVPSSSTPAYYDATLVVDGDTVVSNLQFDVLPGMQGKTVRMSLQFDASAYETGYYDYTLTLVAKNASHGTLSTDTITDHVAVANRIDSEFGNRWWLPFLDRLDVDQALTDGVGLIRGDGTSDFFLGHQGLVYARPPGVLESLKRLTDGLGNTTGYELISPDGWTKYFDADGLLTKVTDRNGREETYSYTDADGDSVVDELASRTDFSGFTTTYNYTNGRLSSHSDGHGVTYIYSYNVDGTLDEITGPPALPGGPTPTISYTYDPTSKLMLTKTDVKGEVTTVTYGSDLRVRTIDRPESGIETVTPSQIAGLDGFVLLSDIVSVSEVDSETWTSVIDSQGNVSKHTDANGDVTEYIRDENGLIKEVRTVNPNNPTGPKLATKFNYNPRGRVTKITYPDGTYNEYTYAANGVDLLSFRDERGKVWNYTVDEAGNRLTETDPLGSVTTYTYDARGNMLSVTLPDPDGAGSLAAPMTQYEYDTKDRVTRITNPDLTYSTFTYDTVTGQLATETDELGNTTSYAYDAYGRVKSITLPDPDGAGPLASPLWGYVWCACGSLKTITDPLGNVTTYDYDAVTGLLETVTSADPDGAGPLTALVTSYDYDALGRLTSETAPGGRVTSYTYDGNGNLLTVTLPDPDDTGPLAAPVTSYAYDALGRQTSMTDPLGQVTTYQYDTRNRVTGVTLPDPDGAGSLIAPVTEYAYDAAGNVLTETDPLYRISNYGYDDLGRVTTITVPAIQFDFGTSTSPLAAGYTPVTHTTTYNAARGYGWLSGSIISRNWSTGTDLTRDFNGTSNGTFVADLPNGTYDVTITLGDTLYTRDQMGIELEGTLVDTVTAPAGQPVTETYTVTLSDGQLTFRLHDLGGSNTLSVVNALQIVSTSTPIATYVTEYDALGRVIAETDPLGNVTSYEYDINSFLVKRTDPDPDGAGPLTAPVTQWGYDDAGRLTSITDPLGQVTTYAYDNLGRQTSVTLPDPDGAGPQTAAVYMTTYDAAGNVLTQTDPLGNVTEYEYDDLHRLISVTDPELGQTTYAYDAVGDLISLTDPVGNVTTWTYDDLQRITAETNELNDTRSWTYDAAGNVLTATDRNGRVIEYDYDNLQRLVQELWKQSTTTLNTIDYAYDAASQLTAVADDVSAYAYVYDGLGRVLQVDNAGTSVGPNVVLLSTYNAAGWRTSNRAVVGSTNDFINTYGYDNLGRMTHVQQVEHGTGNSVAEKRVDFAYNAAGQYESITRYTDITQTNLVAATTFAYDDAHRLTGLSHDQGLTNLADYAWTYDTFGRLTSVTTVDGTDVYAYDDTSQLTDVDSDYQTDETYTYDANGNRTNTGYTTGDNNRLLSDGTSTYEYDAEGNRTKKTSIATGDYVEYAWDHRNRLTSVTFRTSGGVKTKEVQYTYDVFDRRIAKDVDDDGNGTIDWGERYVYDGSDIALVFDESDLLVERLLYGPGIDQPLASEDGSGDVLWFLADNQGTIRDIAEYDDVSGDTSVVNHIQYGGFGNITAQTNASLEPRHTYTGREWDADANLFYYRARWYDRVVGRFISEDPIGFAGGDANLSRYVGNASTNATDPSGMVPNKRGAVLWVNVVKDHQRIEKNFPELTASQQLSKLTQRYRYWNIGYTYIYTREAGWIDYGHFISSADLAAEHGLLASIAGRLRDDG